MSADSTIQSTQEQAVAAWAQQSHVIRILDRIDKFAAQDLNMERALSEMQKLNDFKSSPEHILGNMSTKHGEIAERVQVHVSNAGRLVEGKAANHTFDNVGRLAMEDYLRDGKMVQSKFLGGLKGTFDAIKGHLKKYPNYLRREGSYDIPKDQYDRFCDILHRGETDRSSLGKQSWGNEETLFKAIRQWEKENGVRFQEVVHPSVANYDEVQLGTVDTTIQRHEENIRQKDRAIREQIKEDTSPTIQEGMKVVVTSVALEAGIAFALKTYQKKKSGKRIRDFTEQDWIDVGINTGLGAVKGGVRGSALFIAANYTPVPAPIANALVSATYGIVGLAYKYEKEELSQEEFLDYAEVLCLDVSASAISSIFGQAIIPIPILGALIGNTVGMYLQGIAKTYLLDREQRIIEGYSREAQQFYYEIAKKDRKASEQFDINIFEYTSLLALSFSEDANVRHESDVKAALLAGVPRDKILQGGLEEAEAYFARD